MEFNAQIARITRCADEAAFVQRIWYQTKKNEMAGRNFKDGKYWTYDSAQAILRVFDFWTPQQLRRIVKNCVDLGLVETGHFAQNPFDRRTWYTLTDKARALYACDQTHSPGWVCRNADTHLPEGANVDAETSKYTLPNEQKIYNETLKDTIKDTIVEGACEARAVSSKTGYGEFQNVMLSEKELETLCGRWTADVVFEEIEALSSYMASCGKSYRNHYATLATWLRQDLPEARRAPASGRAGEDGTNG